MGVLLFLLFNTNAHGFFIAGIISAVVTIDVIVRRDFSRGALVGFLIAAVGCVLAFAQLLPPQHAQTVNTSPHWPVAGQAFSQAFFPHIPPYFGAFQKLAHDRRWAAWPMFWGIRVLSVSIFIGTLYIARRNRLAVSIALLSALAVLYLCVFKWYGGERHAGLIFVLLLFVLWVSGWPFSGNALCARLVRCAFLASLICSVVVGLLWAYRDIRWDYSGGKEAAAYIESHALTSAPIAAIPAAQCEPILPYLPHERFWYVGRQEFGTYVKWDGNWTADYALDEAQVLQRVSQQFPKGHNLLIVASKPLRNPASGGYRLIFHNTHFQFDGNAQDENYYLYAHTLTSRPADAPAP
jgi:hypothetical protein